MGRRRVDGLAIQQQYMRHRPILVERYCLHVTGAPGHVLITALRQVRVHMDRMVRAVDIANRAVDRARWPWRASD